MINTYVLVLRSPRTLCCLKSSLILWLHVKVDIPLASIILDYFKCRQRRKKGRKKNKQLLTPCSGCDYKRENLCSAGEYVITVLSAILSLVSLLLLCFTFFFPSDCLLLLPVVIMVLLMALTIHKPSLQHSHYFLLLDLIYFCILFPYSLTHSLARSLPPRSLNVSYLIPLSTSFPPTLILLFIFFSSSK